MACVSEITPMVGMKVKVCDGAWIVEGEIGEVTGDAFYIWQNVHQGSVGKRHPSTKGYKYSWIVRTNATLKIQIKEGVKKMKTIWEVMVIDKEKDEIKVREILIDGDEKSACSKVSIKFADKLKDMVFDNLCYITRELGRYESKKK